jgi:hypothetical protein
MNNTKKRTTLTAMFAIFIAATLVVGIGTFPTTTAPTGQSAYAYKKKDGNGNNNGNTITIQKCKQAATQSGFNNNQGQECENLICTHPGNNATCTEEGVVAAAVVAVPTSTTGQPPTTGTLRVIKLVNCLSSDPNCTLPAICQITVTSTGPPQTFQCQAALENGVLVKLNPGSFNVGIFEEGTPTFGTSGSDGCSGDIAAGQEITCVITNTEERGL